MIIENIELSYDEEDELFRALKSRAKDFEEYSKRVDGKASQKVFLDNAKRVRSVIDKLEVSDTMVIAKVKLSFAEEIELVEALKSRLNDYEDLIKNGSFRILDPKIFLDNANTIKKIMFKFSIKYWYGGFEWNFMKKKK